MIKRQPAKFERPPVAFNLNDDFQRSLYEHAKQHTNFSYYIKTLIQRDMERDICNVSTLEKPIFNDVEGFI